jgi:hypothetical protein
MRQLQHRRHPPRLVQCALHTFGVSVDSLVYVPLEIAPHSTADESELRWTLRTKAAMNAFGIRGSPAHSRQFWAMVGSRRARRSSMASASDATEESRPRGQYQEISAKRDFTSFNWFVIAYTFDHC